MMKLPSSLLRGAAALLLVASGAVSAQTYPSAPIKLVVAFAPGTGSDILGRIIASKLADQMGVAIAVENRAGAGGIIGTAFAAAAYLGLIVTAAGLFLWLHILRHVPAGIAGSVQYLQPVVGIAAAALMFGDRLGLMFAVGSGLIMVGLVLAVTGGRSSC